MNSRLRQNGIKQKTTVWDKIRCWLCGVQPGIVEKQNVLTSCSKDDFRAKRDRTLRKGKQVGAGPLRDCHCQGR